MSEELSLFKLTEKQLNCQHTWVCSSYMLCSNPPQIDKICSKCGLISRDVIGIINTDEYSEIVKKFKGKKK